eukprot:c20576_g1_i5.p1 GENE.c20576_g1_i5~~c20576_g1_i5.p1  ORF type:complete len:124 (+),score=15.83 c20576_g1_i5:699-1070(+)
MEQLRHNRQVIGIISNSVVAESCRNQLCPANTWTILQCTMPPLEGQTRNKKNLHQQNNRKQIKSQFQKYDPFQFNSSNNQASEFFFRHTRVCILRSLGSKFVVGFVFLWFIREHRCERYVGHG